MDDERQQHEQRANGRARDALVFFFFFSMFVLFPFLYYTNDTYSYYERQNECQHKQRANGERQGSRRIASRVLGFFSVFF